MTPIVDDEVIKFEPTGLYNGLVLLSDTKTRSFWNHITGECEYGHYKGKILATDNLFHTTLESALKKYKNVKIAISKQPWYIRMLNPILNMQKRSNKHIMPKFFLKTMEKEDNRLNRSELGIGIWDESKAIFYKYEDINNKEVIIDNLNGKDIIVYLDKNNNIPVCSYITGGENAKCDNGNIELTGGEILDEKPMQLYSRWYGFSYTFKDCEIYNVTDN